VLPLLTADVVPRINHQKDEVAFGGKLHFHRASINEDMKKLPLVENTAEGGKLHFPKIPKKDVEIVDVPATEDKTNLDEESMNYNIGSDKEEHIGSGEEYVGSDKEEHVGSGEEYDIGSDKEYNVGSGEEYEVGSDGGYDVGSDADTTEYEMSSPTQSAGDSRETSPEPSPRRRDSTDKSNKRLKSMPRAEAITEPKTRGESVKQNNKSHNDESSKTHGESNKPVVRKNMPSTSNKRPSATQSSRSNEKNSEEIDAPKHKQTSNRRPKVTSGRTDRR